MIGVRRCPVADEFGYGLCAARESVFETFNHENTRAFAHYEAVSIPVERSGSPRGCFVKRRRKCASCGKPSQTDKIDAGFGSAADCDVRFSRPDQARSIADGLHASCARGHGGADRAFKAVPNGYVAGREVYEKGGNGEW
jgi:hypothetical protein